MELGGVRSPALPSGVTGIKDTSSAFFFVFHLLGLLIASFG